MSARRVTLLKTSPEMKLGVRLSGSHGKPVKVVETNPAGPLAGLLSKNEVLVSINGRPCTAGHQKAAEWLREAEGELVIEIGAKRPSLTQRLSGKRLATQQLTKAQSSFTSLDVPTTTAAEPKPKAEPVTEVVEPPVPAPAPAPPVVQVAQAVAAVTEAVPDKMVIETPTYKPMLAPTTLLPSELAPDEYSVILQRNKCAAPPMPPAATLSLSAVPPLARSRVPELS